MKRYVIFAGVNGSGKTTLYETNPKLHSMHRINIDEIVRGIGSWTNTADILVAGRIAVREIKHCLDEGLSFNQETTLCGKTIVRNIRIARELGYRIEMFYVGLENPDIAVARVNARMQRGGHGVPEEDIRRRYTESLEQLKIILPMCDRVEIFDNSLAFVRIAVFEDGKWSVDFRSVPDWGKLVLEGFNE